VCPGFDSRQGQGMFLHCGPSRLSLGPTQSPIWFVLWVKHLGHEADRSPPSSGETENSVAMCCNVRCLINYAQGLYLYIKMKLTTHLHLVVRQRNMKLYLLSPILLKHKDKFTLTSCQMLRVVCTKWGENVSKCDWSGSI
jgi:hypothetical protein